MALSILITGATGFVGSHILEAMMKIDHADLDIIVACRDRRQLLPGYKGEVRQGDLRDPEYLDHVLAGVDIICHAAGWNALWGHEQALRKLYLKPTLNLIEKAVEWKVKRFVNASSVFAGSRAASAHDPGTTVSYWPQLNHMIAVENFMRSHCHLGCAMVNLRLGVFAGKRHSHSLLPVLASKLKSGELPVMPSGNAGLPVIDGKDIGQAYLRAALAPQQLAYESFNIVGLETPGLNTVVEYLEREFGCTPPAINMPWPLLHGLALFSEMKERVTKKEPALTRSLVHMLRGSTANNERVSELTGFQPEVHWKQAIQNLMDDLAGSTGRKTRLRRMTPKLDL